MTWTIQGKVKHSWTWIFGRFMVGNHTVSTGNMLRVSVLRRAVWARVMIGGRGEVIRILDAR